MLLKQLCIFNLRIIFAIVAILISLPILLILRTYSLYLLVEVLFGAAGLVVVLLIFLDGDGLVFSITRTQILILPINIILIMIMVEIRTIYR